MSAFKTWNNANDYRMTPLRRVQTGRDLAGKVMVVTGATGALGKETCFALYNGGATVIATGRSLDKVKKVCDELMTQEIPTKEVFVKKEGGLMVPMQLDVGDYASIQEFVTNLKAKYPKVDVLLNNAGVIPFTEYTESKHGLEITYQTNFASVVVLTELLLPLMMKGTDDGARIINVSSMSHAHGANPNNWDAVPSNKETFGGYDKDYCESKWLITAYTNSLNERYGGGGNNKIAAVCADPGVSPDSAMWDNVAPFKRFLVGTVFKFLTKTSAQAAACGVQTAVASEIEGGGYYSSGVLDPKGMRPDCREAAEWNKAAAILKGLLPDDLKKLVHSTPTEA
jgi:NAD(P)-dependent dehydrogenase (short-subunit alcohol dehydrogenase family)